MRPLGLPAVRIEDDGTQGVSLSRVQSDDHAAMSSAVRHLATLGTTASATAATWLDSA